LLEQCEPRAWAIEEIGVAKRDVRGSGLHLVLNVLKNDLLRHREESSPINRWDGAMKTKVFATTSCFRIAGQANHSILLKVGILFKRWEGVPPWYCEGETFQKWLGTMRFIAYIAVSALDNPFYIDMRSLCKGINQFDQ